VIEEYIPAAQVTEHITWQDIAPGGMVVEPMTAALVNTGEWRTMIPGFIEDKCRQCLLCAPVCPDLSIPVKNGKRGDFDFMHCKGCGICYKVCPFNAITFAKEEK